MEMDNRWIDAYTVKAQLNLCYRLINNSLQWKRLQTIVTRELIDN